ncbi:MAG TPA: hypothetical protein VK338_04150 [Candidatus Nitrosocosmicus sp.]|nr:hypothetical protein [Candidatus Nitrosocosmicus sp.]
MISKIRIGLLVLLLIIGAAATSFVLIQQKRQITQNKAAENTTPEFIQIVDASKGFPIGHPGQNGEQTEPPYYWFTYAPSIIKENGRYHAFYCSTGGNIGSINQGEGAWDYVRYSSSSDGRTWTRPEVKAYALGHQGIDMSACDPGVVYYQGYYYMYYGSAYRTIIDRNNIPHFLTNIQVARSSTINGQYLTYTERNTWEFRPRDPKKLIMPFVPTRTQPIRDNCVPNQQNNCLIEIFYGLGQPSVIVKNGRLQMWFTDDTRDAQGADRTYMVESDNPVLWNVGTAREISIQSASSTDVKFDMSIQKYVRIDDREGHSRNSYLAISYSADGIGWEPFTTLIPHEQFPNFAHNTGFSSDREGNIISNEPILAAFGAPYDLGPERFPYWDLYGTFVNLPNQNPTSNPTPTPTSAPNTYTISGQVLNVGTARPQSCPANGYPGVNDITVRLSTGQQTVTARGGNYQDGAFYFHNMPAGIYNICAYDFPQGMSPYCNMPREDGRDPFTVTCARVNTNGQTQGIRLVLKTEGVTPSPTVSVNPTHTPAPTINPTTNPTLQPTNTPVPVTQAPTITSRVITPAQCSQKSRGDANCDGRITITDFEIWRSEFMTQRGMRADFNNDRRVSITDFEIWRNSFTRQQGL